MTAAFEESKHPRGEGGKFTNGHEAVKGALSAAQQLSGDNNQRLASLKKRLTRLSEKMGERQMPLEENADYRVVRDLRVFINEKLKPTLHVTPKNKAAIKSLDNAIVQAQYHMTPEGYSSGRFS